VANGLNTLGAVWHKSNVAAIYIVLGVLWQHTKEGQYINVSTMTLKWGALYLE